MWTGRGPFRKHYFLLPTPYTLTARVFCRFAAMRQCHSCQIRKAAKSGGHSDDSAVYEKSADLVTIADYSCCREPPIVDYADNDCVIAQSVAACC
jgi:hypothetical protein